MNVMIYKLNSNNRRLSSLFAQIYKIHMDRRYADERMSYSTDLCSFKQEGSDLKLFENYQSLN